MSLMWEALVPRNRLGGVGACVSLSFSMYKISSFTPGCSVATLPHILWQPVVLLSRFSLYFNSFLLATGELYEFRYLNEADADDVQDVENLKGERQRWKTAGS